MYIKIVNAKKNSKKISQLIIDSRVIDDDSKIATNFNKFFVNVGPSTGSSIPKVPGISPSKFLKNRNQINFLIAHVSNEEILDIIKSLENKSTGPSSIPLKMSSSTFTKGKAMLWREVTTEVSNSLIMS